MYDMENTILKLVETGKGISMICNDDFSAANARAIQESLLKSSARKGDEVLSLAKAISIDVSGIQLAFAWKRALQAQGRKADVVLPQSENIKDLLDKTGITQIF
jgi:hypothetical protein